MVVLLTCKNKEDPIKNEGARVFTTLYIDFSDAQGQITVVVSSRNWNSSRLSCMRLLPTRMRGRTGLVVRASDSGSGDPGSILGRVGVLFP